MSRTPRPSTERTEAGDQILAPWAPALMDTAGPIRTRGAANLPLPLFTQDEDAARRAEALKQRRFELETTERTTQ